MKILEIKTVIAMEDAVDIEKLMSVFEDLETILEDDGFTMITCASEIINQELIDFANINYYKENFDEDQNNWFDKASKEVMSRLPKKTKIYWNDYVIQEDKNE